MGPRVLGMWSLWIMDEKAHKWSQDEGEFDAVMFCLGMAPKVRLGLV